MKFMKCNQPGKDLIHWSEKERKKSKKKKEKEEPTQDDGLVEIERDGNTSARTLLRHRLVWSSSVKKRETTHHSSPDRAARKSVDQHF